MGIQVIHPYKQPTFANHCQRFNGHCTHICLPAPQLYRHSPRTTCACPKNFVLNDDGRSCKPKALQVPVTEEPQMDPVTMEVAEDLVDLVNTEALPLESSSTGQLVGLVLGGVVAASVFASVVRS